MAVQIGWGAIPLGSLLAGVLLQALIAAGMAVTAVAATALPPIRDAGRPLTGRAEPVGVGG